MEKRGFTMKKVMALLLAGSMTAALTACGGNSGAGGTTETTQAAAAATTEAAKEESKEEAVPVQDTHTEKTMCLNLLCRTEKTILCARALQSSEKFWKRRVMAV